MWLGTSLVICNKCRIPGKQQDIVVLMKNTVKMRVLIFPNSVFKNLVWPVQKTDGSWRLTVLRFTWGGTSDGLSCNRYCEDCKESTDQGQCYASMAFLLFPPCPNLEQLSYPLPLPELMTLTQPPVHSPTPCCVAHHYGNYFVVSYIHTGSGAHIASASRWNLFAHPLGLTLWSGGLRVLSQESGDFSSLSFPCCSLFLFRVFLARESCFLIS